ncbi:MAG: peptidyl-alpha-hydroxyglycine alpha-amidating lyase family protein [Acidimicrobiia bacterium]
MIDERSDPAYDVVEGWGVLPDGWSFVDATSVAVDSQDRVIVFNRGEHPVIVLDADGHFLTSWGEGEFKTPHAITAMADGTCWLTDYADHTTRRFTVDGALLQTIGQSGRASAPHSGEPFNLPTDVARSLKSGELYISDGYGNSAVHRFSDDGRHLQSWGRPGTQPGEFNIPHNIAVSDAGLVYVADRENHRIQVFGENGDFLDQINNLHRPAAIRIDERSQLLIVGELPTRINTNAAVPNIGACVSILTMNGRRVARIGGPFPSDAPGQFIAPHGVAVDSQGAIYVAEVPFQARGRFEEPPRIIRSLQKFIPRRG